MKTIDIKSLLIGGLLAVATVACSKPSKTPEADKATAERIQAMEKRLSESHHAKGSGQIKHCKRVVRYLGFEGFKVCRNFFWL